MAEVQSFQTFLSNWESGAENSQIHAALLQKSPESDSIRQLYEYNKLLQHKFGSCHKLNMNDEVCNLFSIFLFFSALVSYLIIIKEINELLTRHAGTVSSA